MPVRVRFRLNKVTGQVEEFLVDDQDRSLPEAEHDRIATEIGRAIARQPLLTEVLPETAPSRHRGPPTDRPREDRVHREYREQLEQEDQTRVGDRDDRLRDG